MTQSDEVNALFKRFDELFAAADYAAAEQEARRLEADVKMRFGEDHAGYSLALEKLATVCERQGKDAEAEKLYERILERREQTPGADLTQALEKLAYVYAKQCKYAKAEQLFKRVGLAQKAPAIKDGTTLQKYWTAAQVPDVVGIVGLLEFLGHSRKVLTASLEYDLQHAFAPGSGAAAAAGSAAQKKPLPNWLTGLVPSRLTLWKASFTTILLIGLAIQFFGLPDLRIPARPTSASNVSTLSQAQERVLQAKDTFKECDACPEMVVVPAGSFTMGSPAQEVLRSNDEGPQHTVTFARAFAVGKFSVTFDEWEACARDGGCDSYHPADEGWGRGRQPVINVSWNDAKSYVAWLSRKTGKTYRLLSEAEREYVTRAGTTTPFWSGPTISTGQANYDGNAAYGNGRTGEHRRRTVPVDSYQPNPWGLYQVHGNVYEWTEDCWHGNYNGAPTDGSAWTSGGDCYPRIVRGGGWVAAPSAVRSAFRSNRGSALRRLNDVGFRVARTLLDVPESDKSEKPQVAQGRALKPKDSFRECDVCPEMVVVPAGSFMMGSPSNELERYNDEGPQHTVTFARAFAVGKFSVTFDEWEACARDGGCDSYHPADEGWGRGRQPVINVSWNDAKSYVAWLSRKTGKTYRLLSEAEREYVTRAGTTTPFWLGPTISTGQANYDGNAAYGNGRTGEYRRRTVPVDSYQPNPWGLYQVHGNVDEWTEDCWHGAYNGAPTDGSAWASGGNCGSRVLRGGSWNNYPATVRAAIRQMQISIYRGNNVGFRVARTLSESPDVEPQFVVPPGLAQVTVLSPAKERALKPKDSFRECDACPEMVVVPAGSFTMGSPTSEAGRSNDEGPDHHVTFARPFAVGKFAVTFDEWDACLRDGGCNRYGPLDEGWGRGRRPVINVSWGDAKSYVDWLSRKTGRSYRLLSEAEREYVTRAGTTTPFWSGLTISTEQANYDGNQTYGNRPRGEYRRQTVPVDSFQPNPWGLYQVHGNVYEWTEDCAHGDYNGAPTDGSPWTSGGDCRYHVYRGGSWDNALVQLRAAFRSKATDVRVGGRVGFRVARTLIGSPETDKAENREITTSLHNAQSTTDRVIAYIERGNAYYSTGDHDRAIADYSEAIKLDGKNAAGYANRALAYQGKGDYDHALSDYNQAISLNSNNALAFSHRASLFSAKGEYDRAVADLSKAITLDPKNIFTYQLRCFVYLNRKDYDHAIADCNEAIRLDPNSDYSLSLRGFVYASRGSFDLAFADCAKAIKLNQKSSAGYNCRGRVHHMKKEFDSAFANYSEAIKLDATNASAYLYRGELNYYGGSYARAIEDFNEAIRLDPKYFQAYNDRGKTYLRRGDNNSAIADFSQAIQLNPLYVEAYNNRGALYQALGLKAAAIDDFRKAQSIDPSDKTSKAQLRSLGG
jgi:formylglycine-generating enzyme required for sulfatase activity/Tfp pilus assembly protein PilF